MFFASSSTKFQFHNGPIKSAHGYEFKYQGGMFQFHNGPIKRLLNASEVNQLSRFNSTMVRLKALMIPIEQKYYAFQFHNGPIKSLSVCLVLRFHHLVSIPQWSD